MLIIVGLSATLALMGSSQIRQDAAAAIEKSQHRHAHDAHIDIEARPA